MRKTLLSILLLSELMACGKHSGSKKNDPVSIDQVADTKKPEPKPFDKDEVDKTPMDFESDLNLGFDTGEKNEGLNRSSFVRFYDDTSTAFSDKISFYLQYPSDLAEPTINFLENGQNAWSCSTSSVESSTNFGSKIKRYAYHTTIAIKAISKDAFCEAKVEINRKTYTLRLQRGKAVPAFSLTMRNSALIEAPHLKILSEYKVDTIQLDGRDKDFVTLSSFETKSKFCLSDVRAGASRHSYDIYVTACWPIPTTVGNHPDTVTAKIIDPTATDADLSLSWNVPIVIDIRDL